MLQGLPAAKSQQTGAAEASGRRECGAAHRDLLRTGALVPDGGGRAARHRRAGAAEVHVQQGGTTRPPHTPVGSHRDRSRL